MAPIVPLAGTALPSAREGLEEQLPQPEDLVLHVRSWVAR